MRASDDTHFLKNTRQGQVRTAKESERERGTYTLGSTERGRSHESEGKRARERHSRSEDRSGRNNLGQGRKTSERVALTSCEGRDKLGQQKKKDEEEYSHSGERGRRGI
jgi:hypothetical protein